MDFEAIRQMDAASSARIEDLNDATAYVKESAILCGVANSALFSEELERRIASAELDGAKDPTKLVSDEQVATAFNFMSDEFRVPHPVQLTGADVLQYRSVMAAIFPHIFSPKSVRGSRPVGTIVMLYQLVYNGGITDGVRKAALLDRPPGASK
jgi:hypothetical protein